MTKLAIGAYEMTFHLAGYVDQTVPVGVSLAAPTKVDRRARGRARRPAAARA